MKSSKSLIIAVVIAVLGAIIFSVANLTLSPSFAFAGGAILTGLVCAFYPPQTSTPLAKASRSKTIYVGNLPYRANESDVKELFAKHGEVFAVRLMKDKRTGKRRGFGFVVMAANDVSVAIEQLNNSEYGERTLKVREANDPRKSEHS